MAKITREELVDRYASGEQDFGGLDFGRCALNRCNFRGANFSNANFINLTCLNTPSTNSEVWLKNNISALHITLA